MSRRFAIPCAVLIVLAVVAPARGQDGEQARRVSQRYVIHVGGMQCPFCTYALERRLNALPDAESVEIDLEKQEAQLEIAEGAVLGPEVVARAVAEAGFSLRELETTAPGRIQGSGNQLTFKLGGGKGMQVRDGGGLDELHALLDDDTRQVVITGVLTEKRDGYRIAVAEARAADKGAED